jgi:hypothetical protein
MHPNLSIPFIHAEVSINRLLNIRQTDLIRGYFACLIPSAILAFTFWILLRLSSRTKLTAEILRSVAGILVLSSLPAFWLYASQLDGWSFHWSYIGWVLECTVAIGLALLFLQHRLPIPEWCCMLLATGHYAFWFWVRGNLFMPDYAGPAAPILGLSSTVAWCMYVVQTRGLAPR